MNQQVDLYKTILYNYKNFINTDNFHYPYEYKFDNLYECELDCIHNYKSNLKKKIEYCDVNHIKFFLKKI